MVKLVTVNAGGKSTVKIAPKSRPVIRSGKRPQEMAPSNLGVANSAGTKNTTLDDISAVVGFTAACRLSHWYGDGMHMYVPKEVEEGHRLARLLGLSAARRLVEEWGGHHLAIPTMRNYEVDVRRRHIGRLFELGLGSREISNILRMSERRVQQICRDLELEGLLPVVGPLKERNEA